MKLTAKACLVLLASISLVACGGDDDDAESAADGGSPATAASPASGGGGGSGGGSGAGTGAGTGFVDIEGVERLTFNVKCQFGTGIVEGPGTTSRSKQAYVRASFPVDAQGRPTTNAAEAGITVKVGTNQLVGRAEYEWVVSDTAGKTQALKNDGKAASGTASFEYRNNNQNPEFKYGETKGGSFEFKCP